MLSSYAVNVPLFLQQQNGGSKGSSVNYVGYPWILPPGKPWHPAIPCNGQGMPDTVMAVAFCEWDTGFATWRMMRLNACSPSQAYAYFNDEQPWHRNDCPASEWAWQRGSRSCCHRWIDTCDRRQSKQRNVLSCASPPCPITSKASRNRWIIPCQIIVKKSQAFDDQACENRHMRPIFPQAMTLGQFHLCFT